MFPTYDFGRDKVRVICPWSEYHGKIGIITGASNYVHIQFDGEIKSVRVSPDMLAKLDTPKK